MSKPRLLDLFCGAGGAAMGYSRAGFEVVGVDIAPQKNYPFAFIQADAMTFPLEGFDAIHASPPCQAFTALRTAWNAKPNPDLLTPMRLRLAEVSTPWVIENVPGAPPPFHVLLCGSMFGLGIATAALRRHRYFQLNWPMPLAPSCAHRRGFPVIGVYGGHGRDRRRARNTEYFGQALRKVAMGIDWMVEDELSEAIPPAYTEFLGKFLYRQAAARNGKTCVALPCGTYPAESLEVRS